MVARALLTICGYKMYVYSIEPAGGPGQAVFLIFIRSCWTEEHKR